MIVYSEKVFFYKFPNTKSPLHKDLDRLLLY